MSSNPPARHAGTYSDASRKSTVRAILPQPVNRGPPRRPSPESPIQPTPPSRSDTSLDDIQDSLRAIRRALKSFKPNEKSTVDDVDEYMNGLDYLKEHFPHANKQGEEGDTLLHLLLKVPAEEFKKSPLLFDWAMKRYPDLYKQGIQEKNSILHLAKKRCKPLKEEYLSDLILRYPSQMADILEMAEDKGELLVGIMPFIRMSSGLEFLRIFGEGVTELRPNQCTCSQCKITTAEMSDDNKPAVAKSEFDWEQNDDILTLSWGTKPTAHTRTSNVYRKTAKPIAKNPPGSHQNSEKQTPLHLASSFCECDDDNQFNLVKRLYAWYPEAIEMTDSSGHSPYLHRVVNDEKSDNVTETDRIAFFLKDRIMHIEDRDTVLDLLYGRPISNSRPESASHSAQQPQVGRRREKEIHMDLCEIQISAPSSKKEDLLNFIEDLQFENILQYVQIPRHPFRSSATSRQALDAADSKPSKQGTGRRDFESIFDTLKKKGVRKILRLMVDDDDACLHQDEVIEKLGLGDTDKCFEIEDFQWRKMDMSSIVLRHAAPHARTLHLFSSGNHSVLRDWSSADGLNQLALLESVHLNIYWRGESERKTVSYAEDFIRRMKANCPQVRTLEVKLEPLTSKFRDEWLNPDLRVITNPWLLTVQKFSSFLGNAISHLRREVKASKETNDRSKTIDEEVRVAILDDGVDWYFAKGIKCTGRSFYVDRRPDFEGQKVWYSSSNDHGTLMAALVQKVCPDVRLFVARLDQTETEGKFQPTAESAVKASAINWAKQMDVHIISMSWTIPGEDPELTRVVQEAQSSGILMFGSASDQGANSQDPPYMSKLSKKNDGGSVICIGGAREAGYADEKARAEAEYFFPGQTHGIPGPLPHMKSNFGSTIGSSVATAIAAGLAALMMRLTNLSKYASSYRSKLQDPTNIRSIFSNLLYDPKQNIDETRVIPVEKFFPAFSDQQIQDIVMRGTVSKTLDRITERILRALIEQNGDWMKSSDDSPQEFEIDPYEVDIAEQR